MPRLTLCDSTNFSKTGFLVLYHLPEFAQTHVHWVGDVIQPSHPLSHPSPPALKLPQHQGLFQWVDSYHQVPKYWSFSISISPSNEYSGLISNRIDWVYLLTVEGHLRVFFCTTVQNYVLQLLHTHMATGKTIVLTRGTFVDKVMSLLFNILSGLS